MMKDRLYRLAERVMSDEWEVGGVHVTKVEEQIWPISPRWLFANADYDTIKSHADGTTLRYRGFQLSIHSFILRTAHHTILVDSWWATKERNVVRGIDESPYLERLAAAGVQPEDVDLYSARTCMSTMSAGTRASRTDVGFRLFKRALPVQQPSLNTGQLGRRVSGAVMADSVPIIEATG